MNRVFKPNFQKNNQDFKKNSYTQFPQLANPLFRTEEWDPDSEVSKVLQIIAVPSNFWVKNPLFKRTKVDCHAIRKILLVTPAN